MSGVRRNYKMVLILTLGSLLLVIVLIWNLAISKTVNEISLNSKLKVENQLAEDLPLKQRELEKKIKSISNHVNSEIVTSNDFDQKLLIVLNKYCRENNLVIRNLPERVAKEVSGMTLLTSTFTIEGDFVGLIKLIYALDQHERIGKVNSAGFVRRTENKTQTSYLTVDVYIQNIVFNSSNEVKQKP